MLDHFLRDRAAAQRLRANPIGSHLDGFTAWLAQCGYAWATIRQHVWALATFGRWFHRRRRSVRDLRRRDADDFCRRHCTVPRRQRDTAALGLFLAYLEAAHLMPVPARVIDRSPVAQIKARYAAYLQHDRALSPCSATSTQWRKDDSVSPRSRAAAATVFPCSSTSRTAPALKSSVKLRRVRRGVLLAILDIVSTFPKVSTKSDQAQAAKRRLGCVGVWTAERSTSRCRKRL